MVAVATALQAHVAGGHWLLRIEDVDETRVVVGSAQRIMRSLQAHGLQWQGEVWIQSQRKARYEQALTQLLTQGDAFFCACSRADLPPGGVYPGTCRDGLPEERSGRAYRLRVDDAQVAFVDTIQGRTEQDLAKDVGDFIIRRADGLFAYQLAVVLDDADQHITQVVRGADLLDSTPRQILLQQRLGLEQPDYFHLPLLLGPDGKKLSKRNFSNPLSDDEPLLGLRLVMALMGHKMPPEIHTVAAFWAWAMAHWDQRLIPRRHSIRLGHTEPAVILQQLQQELII
jgi:glutamyl-Q tRNA(Asp) synthetase